MKHLITLLKKRSHLHVIKFDKKTIRTSIDKAAQTMAEKLAEKFAPARRRGHGR